MSLCNFSCSTRWCLGILFFIATSNLCRPQEPNNLDDFRQRYQKLRELMQEDLDEAEQFVEASIARDPDSVENNVLRQSLASGLLAQQRQREAVEQLGKLLEFQLQRVEVPENQLGLWMTLQSVREIDPRNIGPKSQYSVGVQRGFDALLSVADAAPMRVLFPLSQVAAMRAQVLAAAGEQDEARDLVTAQVQRLIEINRSERANEETTQTLISMLRVLTSDAPENDAWRKECIDYLDKATNAAIKKYPKDIAIQNAYAETQLKLITQWQQDDPEATEARIESVGKQLSLLAFRNRSLQGILRRIKAYEQSMQDAKPPETLVGKPVPKWDIDGWVNVPETTQDSFQGKVVLIDFWAMWCGPCIATFPHLRQWREEFGEQDFEIVGVTQYYNFAWDDLTQRASASDTPVAPEDERRSLARFLEHHNLSHPVFVTPKGSGMGGEFGVRGIPHVVLVDREGVVQLIRTGAGEETASEVYAKIKELVNAKEPSEAQ